MSAHTTSLLSLYTNQLMGTLVMLCPHLNQTGTSLERCEVQGSASCLVCMVNICSTIQQALRSLHSATQTCPTQGSKSLPVLSQHTCPCTNSRTELIITKLFMCGSTFQDSNDLDVSNRIPIHSAQSCRACKTLVNTNKIHSMILPSVEININI
jgi:hypothetical protein